MTNDERRMTNVEGRDGSPVPATILFDGVCNLCNGFVQFVIERDPGARFRFASLQSRAAAALLNGHLARGPIPDSVVLVEGDRVFTQSTAALRVARGLGFPWNVSYLFVA